MSKELEMIPANDEFQIYQVMAKKASESKFFATMGGEAAILSIMLMARELGLPPMQSIMGGMNIIQGKVEISPRMMNTMIRKAGHKLRIIVSTDQECRIQGIRHDTKEEYISNFSIDDASGLGLCVVVVVGKSTPLTCCLLVAFHVSLVVSSLMLFLRHMSKEK